MVTGEQGMRGLLTVWLFGMGLLLFCAGGWALQQATKGRPGASVHTASISGRKTRRLAHSTVTPGKPLRGQRRSEHVPTANGFETYYCAINL
jgi:hypothetical protein